MKDKKAKDTTSRYYFNKLEGEELFETLSMAVEKSAEMTAWLKGKETQTQQYYPTRLEKKTGRLYLEYHPGFLKPKKSDFIGQKIFLKMNLGKFYIFGHGTLHLKDEDDYFLELTSEFYKSQQRENLRVEAHPGMDIKIKLKIENNIYDISDLSAGGASFYVQEEKITEFEKDKIFSKILITAENETFKVPRIQVVKTFESKDKKYSNYKCVAVKFMGISTEEETKLVVKLTTLKRKIDLKKGKFK